MMLSSWLLGTVLLCTVTFVQPINSNKNLVVAPDSGQVGQPDAEPPKEPVEPIRITEMFVNAEISLRYAHTAIVTEVVNNADSAQNATFHVLLPNTAFISGFVMTLNGVSYKAYVKEKKEAQKIYDDAVSQGKGAAQVSTARDSNHFAVSVNVEPHTVAVFNLTCEELLTRSQGVYNYAVNINPGQVVPDLSVCVRIQESGNITTLRVPELRTGNEVAATESDPQYSKVEIKMCGKEATVIFKPTQEEQVRLMKEFENKTKTLHNNENKGSLGQIVVQYDVDVPDNGEILVNNGYFVHFLGLGENLPPLYKHVIFILDTSGSMMGDKIRQLIEAMNLILGQLRPLDYFSIVEFSTNVHVHNLDEAKEQNPVISVSGSYPPPEPPKLVPPYRATKENIADAVTIVNRLKATSSTNIYDGLRIGVELANKGIGWTPEGDAADECKKLDSIIVFLTDGLANVAVSNTTQIVEYITQKNHAGKASALFSLGFGQGADINFLRKLSLRNNGFARHIYEAADATAQLFNFYKIISSPLLSNVTFTYPPDQIVEGTVTESHFPYYFLGSDIVVAGKVANGSENLTPEVSSICAVREGSYERKTCRSVPIRRHTTGYYPLERIWAYLTVQKILEEMDATDDKAKKDELEKRGLAIALEYEFVTPLTSLVVVKPDSTNAVDPTAGDKGGRHAGMPGAPGRPGMSSAKPGRPGSPGKPGLPGRPSQPSDENDAPAVNPLTKYRLEEYPWTKDLLQPANDTLTFIDDNGSLTTLKLSTDVANDPADEGGKCEHAISGSGPGVCTYLPKCTEAKSITSDDYKSLYCDLNGFAGVCCPATVTN
nr:inter alpha trypsin inhibitor heavy chain H4 [Tineola bisselliella]